MEVDFEVVSVDGLNRVTVFRRDDDTFGYVTFRNVGDDARTEWQEVEPTQWGFGSGTSAMLHARTRIEWLARELDWPAKSFEPQTVEEFMHGWIECPKCHIRFSLQDSKRWAGGRHQSCGQRIIVSSAREALKP